MKKLLITAVLIVALNVSCSAGPSYDALKSFRVLVPDFSKTSGGLSPAISPSGDDLAYYSGENISFNTGDVYLLVGCISLLGREGTTVDPKKLEYEAAGETSQNPQRNELLREMDWSPDGNSLTFVGKGGHLYIAHVFDPVGKKPTEVQVIALADSGHTNWIGSIGSPRWSPDGKMIAFTRNSADNPAKVCVVDLASRQEKVLAEDAIKSLWTWEQPWSPDSKTIVYTGGKASMSLGFSISSTPPSPKAYNKEDASFIAAVSVDGNNRTEIAKGPCLCPSWSPKGDRVVYMSTALSSFKLADKRYLGGVTMALWTTDAQGKAKEQLTHSEAFSSKKAAEYEMRITKAAAGEFEKEYAAKLTSTQLKKLKSGNMNLTEMIALSRNIVSKETGVDLKKVTWPPEAKKTSANDPKVSQAYTKAMGFITRALTDTLPQWIKQLGVMDKMPVWSPDGRKLAYVQGFLDQSYINRLMLLDVTTGKSDVLMEQADIESISWTKNSKFLVTQGRRLMSRQETGVEVKSQPGYPEIWMLEPK